MFAAQYKEHTKDVTNVKLNRIDKPRARPGMVVVRVQYASTNPADTHMMAGHPNFNIQLPFTVGYDLAGVIEEISEADKSLWKLGDRVYTTNWGNHENPDPDNPCGGAVAEFVLLPGSRLSRTPDNVSSETASSLVMAAGTSLQMIDSHLKITASNKLLILGGAGAVGTAAIQIAKLRGAWVATTCSTRNLAFVNQFKPDLVVDYTKQNWWEHPALKDLDAVLDCVGTSGTFTHVQEKKVLKSDGAFLTVAFPCGFEVGFNPAGHPPLRFAAFVAAKSDPVVQDALASMVGDGRLVVPVNKVFPFTEEGVQAALRETQSGKSVGKNIIKIT